MTAGEAWRSPFDLAWSPDGRRIAVSDRTAAAVYIIDAATCAVQRTIAVRQQPRGLAWLDDGTLCLSEYSEDALTLIDIAVDDGNIRRVEVAPRPIGVAVAPRSALAVTCGYGTDGISLVDVKAGRPIARISAVRHPYFAGITPDESLALVGNLLPGGASTDANVAAALTVIDLKNRQRVADILLPYGSSNLRGICISPDGRWAYAVHTRGRVNLPTSQLERGWINTNALSIIDLREQQYYATILLDHPNRGAADPWGVALSPDGCRLWITLAGVDQVAVVDLAALHKLLNGEAIPEHLKPSDAGARIAWEVWESIRQDPSRRTDLVNELAAPYAAGVLKRVNLPVQGPRGIAVSPDGATLAVAGYYSGDVIMLDAATLQVKKRITLGSEPALTQERRGEMIFHDGDNSLQGWLSCSTCHPDGRADGLNWDLLNDGIGNPKNTKSLVLTHETPPSMALGVRADYAVATAAGFQHIVFRESLAGELEAVKAYLRSMRPEPGPVGTDDRRSAQVVRGKAVFENPKVGCASCHHGPFMTDLKSYDVGTGGPQDYESSFDNPTLVEIWRTPPYLHNGSAATLRDVLCSHNPHDKHGVTSHLSETDIDALVAYLQSI